MRRLFVLSGLLGALLVALGCSSTRIFPSDDPLVDSLQAENATLRSQLRQAKDSLQFRTDLETGQYYRDRRRLEDRLNRLTYEVRTLRDGGFTVRLFPADSLFESGTATLTSAGEARLQTVIARLQTSYPTRTIRVEGHADDTPLSDALQERFASNWELSGARATAVVRHLIAHSDLDPAQFTAVAYGSTEPVASNATARGRQRNRRVRIAVLPSPRDYSRPFELAW